MIPGICSASRIAEMITRLKNRRDLLVIQLKQPLKVQVSDTTMLNHYCPVKLRGISRKCSVVKGYNEFFDFSISA
jgi:hypothetical protein